MRPEGSGCGELSNDDYGDESWHVEHSGADNGVEGAAHALASTDMCNGFAMALALLICSEPEAETNMEHAEHFMELKSLGPWHFEVDTEVEETSGPGAFTLPLFAAVLRCHLPQARSARDGGCVYISDIHVPLHLRPVCALGQPVPAR